MFLAREDFDIHSLEDEIRVDEQCTRFLRLFHQDLMARGLDPVEAGALAHGADYFLREFIIPDRRENIFALRPGRVRQFAGNWYIIKTLEPNMTELEGILQGILAFYEYCRRLDRVTEELLRAVREECGDLDYYRRRIESFWAIREDGYFSWERECSLKE